MSVKKEKIKNHKKINRLSVHSLREKIRLLKSQGQEQSKHYKNLVAELAYKTSEACANYKF